MVKFCYRCKKVFPIETKKCPICGDERLMRFCPNCRQMVPEGVIACPFCGDNDPTIHQTFIENKKKPKSKKILTILLGLFIIVGVLILFKYLKENSLSETDKQVYELVLGASYQFKNPSSVRIISGSLRNGNGVDLLAAKISLTNSYGISVKEYCLIWELDDGGVGMQIIEYDGSQTSKELIKFCNKTTYINANAVNKKLDKHWK